MKFGWLSELDARERRTFFAAFGGLGLDSMDTTIYALVMPTLLALAIVTKAQAGVLASLSLIGMGIGGWLAGSLADRYGRVRMLQITIVWVAVFTAATALMHEFWGLAFVRAMQGLGYGGEAAVGGVLVSEVVASHMRGRVAAAVQSGYAVGNAVSVAVLPLIFYLAPDAVAWRIAFAVGVLPALFVWFIRRFVPEPELFVVAEHKRLREAQRSQFWQIFAKPHLRTTLIAAIMSTGIFGGAYTMITWLPTYLRTALNLSVTSTSGYLAVNIFGSLVGPLAFGWLADRIGRRYSFMAFLALQALNVATYTLVPIGATTTVVLGFFLGAFQGGLASGMMPTFSELFPTGLRGSGQGFCLSGGRGFAAVVPSIVGLLVANMSLGGAMASGALCSYVVAFAAALALPEKSGVELSEVD